MLWVWSWDAQGDGENTVTGLTVGPTGPSGASGRLFMGEKLRPERRDGSPRVLLRVWAEWDQELSTMSLG